MAKKKKITRKQLLNEPDEFLTFSGKLLEWAVKNKNKILFGFTAILALALVITGVQYFSNRAENRAFALLQERLSDYETLNKEGDSQKAYAAVKEDFDSLLKEYAGKNAGKLARVFLADICFDAKDFDRAISLYNQALPDYKEDKFYYHLLLTSLGQAYEEKKAYDDAARVFEMITAASDASVKDEAYFHLGAIYEAMGKTDKSTAAYGKILSDFSDSLYFPIVKEKNKG